LEEGRLAAGDSITARVDGGRRAGICRSHTSTHLLHRALRNRLGDHVNQAGSLVASDRLRFDFNHFSALSADDLKEVEQEVNKRILDNLPVKIEINSLDEAKEKGATALFTDKYEEEVRVVSAGDYTCELCGGTHVPATGSIGLFRILSEEGIGSGLRRIEAVTGMIAYQQAVEQEQLLKNIAEKMHTSEKRIEEKVEEYVNGYKQLQKQNQELKQKMAGSEIGSLLDSVKEIDGVRMLSAIVAADSVESLRLIMDEVRNKLGPALVVLGSENDGKVFLVGSASPEVIAKGIQANKVIKQVAGLVGGGGGGKPELAQAGGKNPAALPEAIASVENLVKSML
jgi:alanyl-tRNA synthetase